MDKNILIVINSLGVGGAERVVVDDINEMVARKVNVKLLTLKKETDYSLAKQCLIDKAEWINIHFSNIYDFRGWVSMIKFFKKNNFDLVITHLWFANTVIRIATGIMGLKNIISFEQNLYDSVKNKKMFFVDWVLQYFCKKIIAVSNTVKSSLISHGIKASNIDVIYNSINIDKYSSAKAYDRYKLGIDSDSFIFLFVGRLIHQKGIDILIDAFSKIGFKSVLLIVGRGQDDKILMDKVSKLGLHDRVHFLGVRQDIPELLATCDCFVFTSRYEGLPLAVLEALAVGKPIIVSDFNSARDLVEHKKSAIVVPVEDRVLLKEAMENIFKDGAMREKMSKEAIIRSNMFSIKSHVDKILSYLN